MFLTHLSLTNFRNFSRLDLDVPSGSVLLVGRNAQGKTSLLEAIYFLATFTSFHTNSDRQMINFLAAHEPLVVGRIVADFKLTSAEENSTKKSDSIHRLEVRLIQEASGMNSNSRVRKEILLDGVPRKINDAVGVFNAVLFLPQMLRVVEGAPEERRRYLNLAMGQVLPGYSSDLAHYSQVLTQRNALLKQLGERGGDIGQLTFWDEQLASFGGRIIQARIRTVQELEHLASQFHRDLTRSQEILRLSYQPAYDPFPNPTNQLVLPIEASLDRSRVSLDQIRQGFMERLFDLRGEEIARGMTTIGPHRDDLHFLSNGIDLCEYGSRGQGRTAILSLKLAEVAWMKDKSSQWPVLLLDEVLAELDSDRRADMLDRLMGCEQTLLTTTDLDMFHSEFVQNAKIWRIQAGQVVV